MNVLFDLISSQGFINGGAEYTIKIFYTLLYSTQNTENKIYAIYDSKIPVVYDIVDPDYLAKNFRINCVDVNNKSISGVVSELNIDTFFVGIGQQMNNYNLENINCRTICVIHDLDKLEIDDNKLLPFLAADSLIGITKWIVSKWKNKIFHNKEIGFFLYKNLMSFVLKKNVEVVTVSNYSAFSLKYYYPELSSKIEVLYSPPKIHTLNEHIENDVLKNIVKKKIKYFVVLSANRKLKNAALVIKVFKKFAKLNPDFYLLTIGKSESEFNNHLVLPYLSTSDLEYAQMHSYALIFPTLFEGFGYPPIEAMKYGKPVICSNVCSMPEILENAPVYFSPFYKADLFKSLFYLIDNYNELIQKTNKQYAKIKLKQENALDLLIKKIIKTQ